MSIPRSEKIGEGSYGCAFKPSLPCTEMPVVPNFRYEDYVSKLMKIKDARKEQSEVMTISLIDPENKYHLGIPMACNPNISDESVKQTINTCRRIKSTNIQERPDKYILLLSKYGGYDLANYCDNHMPTRFDSMKEKQQYVDEILLNFHHLMMGIKLFKENGVVHHDIKPQNILFNPVTKKMMYIDFGLTTKKDTIIEECDRSTYDKGIFWWSLPLNCIFLNKKNYELLFKYPIPYKSSWLETQLVDKIIKERMYDIFFSYTNKNVGMVPNEVFKMYYIRLYLDSIRQYIQSSEERYDEDKYLEFVNKVIDSIDIYGLGFTIQFFISQMLKKGILDDESFTLISSLLGDMYSNSISKGLFNIDYIITKYEDILEEIHLLDRINKTFENHELVDRITPDEGKEQESPLPIELQQEAYNDPPTNPEEVNRLEIETPDSKFYDKPYEDKGGSKNKTRITKKSFKKRKHKKTYKKMRIRK